MVRSVDIFFISGESFINYCSDNKIIDPSACTFRKMFG